MRSAIHSALAAIVLLFSAGCDRGEYAMTRGNEAYHHGNWQQASSYYMQAAEANDFLRPAALYNLSRVATSAGDSKAALAYLNDSLVLAPLDASARLDRARLLLEHGDQRAAESDLVQAVRSDAGLGEAWLLLANLRAADGRSADALRALPQALADPRVRAEALLMRGSILLRSGDLAAALRTLEQASAEDPFSAQASFQQARVLVKLGDPREAARRFQHGLTLSPKDQSALRDFGALQTRIQRQLGQKP